MDRSVKLSRVIALVSIMFASCSNDELKEIYQGEEITFTTQVGRAVETNLKSLDGFYVYADAPGAKMFIEGDIAKKEGNDGKYVFENSYFWPQGVETMKFWAYGPQGIIDKGQVSISEESQILNNFTPAENPENQKDLVVAYTESKRDGLSAMSVPLTFHHALSQIVVKAKCPSANKKVYIKGVWVVNVNGTGTLKFSNGTDAVNYMEWDPNTLKGITYYGKKFNSGTGNYVQLTSTLTSLLDSASNSNLMLVPQQKNGLAFDGDGNVTEEGTYILLLCRVEAEHEGAYHADGSSGVEGGGFVKQDGDNHIHQLFPIVGDKFNEDAYGYTCVPLSIDWKPGKKYVYNLEFCGHSSGAGIYPPANLPDGLPEEGEKTPDDKWGQPVLDYPISFTVTVDSWSTNTESEDVEMN